MSLSHDDLHVLADLVEDEILAIEGEIEDGENVEENRRSLAGYEALVRRIEQELAHE